MNNNSYIYANSRIAALESELLSASQLERMVSAKSADEAFLTLNDTFLAPYIAGGNRQDLPRMLRKSVSATQRLITQIVPDQDLFAVLWLRYDFYNLKTIIKGKKVGLSDKDILEKCFHSGVFTLEQMMDAVASGDVGNLHSDFGRAYKEAQEAQQVYEIDIAMNKGYFRAVRNVAQEVDEPFVCAYVEKIIDFFNLKTQLRLLALPVEIDRKSLFVDGGSFDHGVIMTQESILDRFGRMGDGDIWKEAIATFIKTGDFAVLEKASDDTLLQFVKSHSTTILSPVPVFGYFLAHRNNTQIIKTVLVAKESGMSEVELRRLLRKLYS